ncbi:MAG: glycoside hydrolase family 13 protein [Pseudomonadota bacterium]
MIKLSMNQLIVRKTLLFFCAVAGLNYSAQVDAAPACTPAPFGQNELFLRGTMSNWVAAEEYAFAYQCDAYYLNVKLDGKHEFKIAEESWRNTSTIGSPVAQLQINSAATEHQLPAALASDTGGINNLSYVFVGAQTIRLAFTDPASKPILSIVVKNRPDPLSRIVSNKLALSLRHDSRQLTDKSPFGAVKAGSKVSFGLTSLAGIHGITLVIEKRKLEGDQEVLEYTEVVRLPMHVSATDKTGLTHWKTTYQFKDVSVYGYYFETRIGDKTYVYQNNKEAIYWTREKGANGLGLVDEKPASNKRIRRFRHTVYSADFVVPSWAKDVVYYYIFPDRFRNGDTSNDPKPGINTYHDQPIEFHSNWLDKPYLSGTGDGSDKVYSNDFFGGDIAGIIEKLDYIADLGANTVYITPMFTASSNHKYDTADYKNIDPAFGSNADFTRLTVEAAKRGIRVIPDTSLNHSGSDSLYFDRFAKYDSKGAFRGEKVQADSPYASWYTFDRKQSEPDKQYKGWVGVADLPELNKASSDYRRFAFGDKDSVTRMWLDRGAAGWRMDVAPWVPDDFWREWRKVVKQQKPDAMTIAETWFDASKYFLGDTFDSAMNYIFRNTILEYAAGGKANALYHNIELMREAYPPQSFYAMMNLLSSHDQPRALHYFGYVDDKTDPAKIASAKQRQRLAMFFQMTFPGSPTIYYGDEVALTGGEDPFNRAAYPWADKGGKPDLQMLSDVKAILKIRKDNAVIRHGSIAAPLLIDEHVIVLARQLGKTWAITATNNNETDSTVTFKIPKASAAIKFVDASNGKVIHPAGTNMTLVVPALFGSVLIGN